MDIDSLSSEIKESLNKYTSEFYYQINEPLRNKTKLSSEAEIHWKNIKTAFENAPGIKEPIVVYRGDTDDKVKPIMTAISTTRDYGLAASLSEEGCCVFEITVPIGTKILDIEKISELPAEKEILLPYTGFFRKTDSYVDVNGITIINLVYVPDGDDICV